MSTPGARDGAAPLGLLVVDHGSRRAESNAQLEDVARRVQRLRPDCVVRHAHMELAPPSIGDGIDELAAAGCDDVRVLLYFLSDGRHVSEDVPALVADAAARHEGLQWQVGRALGPHDALARLLLERAGVEKRPFRGQVSERRARPGKGS